MSSNKKKPTLTNCTACSAVYLAKDAQRHMDFCGQDVEDVEISCIKNGILRGFNVSIDKAEGYLPPDAIGWEKEHSILMSPQTMEYLEILARQPVILHNNDTRFVGIVWPCKEIPLLKSCVISQRVQKERMITIEKCANIENVKSMEIEVEGDIGMNSALKAFIEIYLKHAYLQYDVSISFKYFGQQVRLTPKRPIDEQVMEMNLDGNKKSSKILQPSSNCSFHFNNFHEKTEEKVEKSANLDEIGGMFSTKQVIQDYVLEAIRRKELPCSVLIWGLPGSGKTFLLRKLATMIGSCATMITNTETLIEFATLQPKESQSKVVIIDVNDIDKDDNQKIIKALSNLLEDPNRCIILSVRSSESVELGIRVKFPVETEITVPTQDERIDILSKIRGNYGMDGKEDMDIARTTHGFTVGDLCSLLKTAKFSRGATIAEKLQIARKRVRPTGIRQFILEVPTVTWNDIGGNNGLKLEIQQAVIWPQKHPEAFERFGIDPPAGILLYGPPGCSKTLVARALANEAKMNFLAVKGPELFSKWVGDSEKAIRDLFSRARQVAPTIVFFDEIDAVGSSRGSEKSSGVSDRVLAQLLTELDGLEKSARVILLAASNRPDQLDSALLRPGRLDRAIYVGLPCEVTRREILKMRTNKMKMEDTVKTLDDLVKRTDGYSGAELVAVCRTAAMYAMRENIQANDVKWRHFEEALTAVVPRTEQYLLDIYDDFRSGKITNA